MCASTQITPLFEPYVLLRSLSPVLITSQLSPFGGGSGKEALPPPPPPRPCATPPPQLKASQGGRGVKEWVGSVRSSFGQFWQMGRGLFWRVWGQPGVWDKVEHSGWLWLMDIPLCRFLFIALSFLVILPCQ